MNLSFPKNSIKIASGIALAALLLPTFAFASVENFVWQIVVGFFGSFMGLAGVLLNMGVNEFVIGFGDLFLNDGIGASVNKIWISVRDIFNITFIFGLVYIGFKIILDSDDSNTKRWLVNLIVAALLVNFSLYFTKFIVDISNLTATQIAQSGFLTATENGTFAEKGEVLISDTYMDSLGITSIIGPKAVKELAGKNKDSQWGYIFGTMILFIIATFVFAAGGLLLIIRFVALLLYMVLSPFMFIGWVFPQLQRYTSMYWSGFLGRAFFAPLYLLLLYFGAQILYDFKNTRPNSNFDEIFTKPDGIGLAGTLAPFIVGSIFLIAAIVIAQKMSDQAASGSMQIGRRATDFARRSVRKGMTNTARYTGKTAAYFPAKGAGWAARRGSAMSGAAIDKALTQLQEIDASKGRSRFTRGVGRAASGAAKLSVVDNAVRGGTTKMKNAKFGLQNTDAEAKRKQNEINARVTKSQDIKSGRSAKAELDANRSTLSQADIQRLEQVVAKGEQTENNLSAKELDAMLNNDKATFDQVVGNINANTFDKLMDSDDYTPDQKSDMLKNRKKAITDVIEESGATLTEDLQNMSIKQIETMGDQFIRDNAALFSASQMEDIKKSKVFTESQKGSYIGKRKAEQIAMATDPARRNERDQLFGHNNRNNVGTYEKARKAVDIANLPIDAFVNPDNGMIYRNNIEKVDGTVLEEIFNKKTMTVEQRNTLKSAIQSHGTQSAKDYLDTAQGQRNWN